jgi:hypothetical protein
MAGQQLQRLTPKQQALRDLELARHELARESGLAADEWSPRAVLTRSFENHRMLWIAGSLVAGLAAIRLLLPSAASRAEDGFDHEEPSRRRPSGGLTGGIVGLLAGPLIQMGRKAVTEYGMQWAQAWLQGRQTAAEQNEPPPAR